MEEGLLVVDSGGETIVRVEEMASRELAFHIVRVVFHLAHNRDQPHKITPETRPERRQIPNGEIRRPELPCVHLTRQDRCHHLTRPVGQPGLYRPRCRETLPAYLET